MILDILIIIYFRINALKGLTISFENMKIVVNPKLMENVIVYER